MIITDPKYNQPESARCEKCGKIFMKQPWSDVYSSREGLIILCPKCAAEELEKGTVSNILY